MVNSDKGNNVIRHYTNIKALYGILRNGFRFSSGLLWTDKDDKYDIEQYRLIINQDVSVLCFCDGLGSIYHWTNLGSNLSGGRAIKCYIAINKEPFLKYVASFGKYEPPRNLIYCHDVEILAQKVEDIPYLKNREYAIENELRFLYVGDDAESACIPDVVPFIKCISISCQDCTREDFVEIKNKIESLYPLLRGKIIQNMSDWKNKIDLLIRH